MSTCTVFDGVNVLKLSALWYIKTHQRFTGKDVNHLCLLLSVSQASGVDVDFCVLSVAVKRGMLRQEGVSQVTIVI